MDRAPDPRLENTAGEATPNDALEAKRYFQNVEDLLGDPSLDEARLYEIGKPPAVGDGSDVARRDFMTVLGMTFAAVGLGTGCARQPVQKALPYVLKPEEIVPGNAVYYATDCRACAAGCGLLVKARDGRPIKVEGNPEHPLSLGSSCAFAQASVLNLYDGDRLRAPLVDGKAATWTELQARVDKALAGFRADGSKLAVVTRTTSGPASAAVVAKFLSQFPGARHVVLAEDASSQAVLEAHAATHDKAVVPFYRFDEAQVIVSIGADFLGTWIQPVAFARQWAQTRKLSAKQKRMSKHIQIETQMTLTGSNADERLRILPSQERAFALGLAGRVVRSQGIDVGVPSATSPYDKQLDAFAKLLAGARGKSLVVSGSADVVVQAAVNVVNHALGNYGKTVDLAAHLHQTGRRAEADKLLEDLTAGALQGVVLVDVNPVYDSPRGAQWAAGLKKTAFSLALSGRADETAKACQLVAATHHPLECWGDSEPQAGLVNVQQPLVRPLFDTAQAEDLLLQWSNEPAPAANGSAMLAFMQKHWQRAVMPRVQGVAVDFQIFWDKAVHDGFVQLRRVALPGRLGIAVGGPMLAQAPQGAAPALEPVPAAAEVAAVALAAEASPVGLPADATPVEAPIELPQPAPGKFNPDDAARALKGAAGSVAGLGKFELVAYEKVGMRRGRYANNPLLQELPDPVSKATWGNYACVSPATAAKLGLESSDVVEVTGGDRPLRLPVVLQPGLHDEAIAIAVGYGRTAVGRVGNGVGGDVGPLAGLAALVKVDLKKTGDNEPVAFSQTHHSYEHRDIVRETTLPAWQATPDAGNVPLSPMLNDPKRGKRSTRTLWTRHEYPGYKWSMAIDLNACTGCGACVIACNVENNVPIVGKREVLVRRELHWLRIDRYFSERKRPKGYDWDPTGPDLLAIADNPEVVHQPMLCQHCDHAPCETVCPVLATVHTAEGLNSQAYNRCIGTRYCENNCPYKVRRFNWFNYPTGDMEGKQDLDIVALALNPDITPRSRGVMEKCSFCVQRIGQAKSEAVKLGKIPQTDLRDGDVVTACQQACPTEAIVFGNINDVESGVRKQYEDPRNYSVLAEVGTGPAVTYMTKVRNSERLEG
jgi:molybdopterin-containing oxidoreductase family iron-sulfur binding subunit